MIRAPIDGLFEDPRKKLGVALLVLEMDDGVGACLWTCPIRVYEVVNDLGVSCMPLARVWFIHNHSISIFPVVASFFLCLMAQQLSKWV